MICLETIHLDLQNKIFIWYVAIFKYNTHHCSEQISPPAALHPSSVVLSG